MISVTEEVCRSNLSLLNSNLALSPQSRPFDFFLVLEYCQADLRFIIEDTKKIIDAEDIRSIIKQLLTGISYLHR